ncbi:MAG: molybdate ABC transporter substrate-binding protein [Chitinophagaceae bacterium]
MEKLTWMVFFCTLIFPSGCHSPERKKLVIATAANVQYAMEALTQAFTRKTHIPCEIIIGSSGQFSAQIQSGAPYDVFVAADLKYPQTLFQEGFTEEKPRIYAWGKLVLWSMRKDIPPHLEELTQPDISSIALANPSLAPYGQAAMEVLQKTGIYDQVKNKLVWAESIAQTNQFIYSGTADLGFTAKSVVESPQMKGKGKWLELPEKDYSPIAQGVVVLKTTSGSLPESREFYQFLFSKQGQFILKEYGYQVPP